MKNINLYHIILEKTKNDPMVSFEHDFRVSRFFFGKKKLERAAENDICSGNRIGLQPVGSALVFFNFLPDRDPLQKVNNRTTRFPEINVPFSRFQSALREEERVRLLIKRSFRRVASCIQAEIATTEPSN